jgi:hypothetical protein
MLRLLPREKGVLYCDIVFEVRDAKGKLVKTRKVRSRSLVANFLRVIREQMIITGRTGPRGPNYYGGGATTVKDVGGTLRAPICGLAYSQGGAIIYPLFAADGGAGDVNKGIRVGTGTTTPTPDDYCLAAPIGEGTGPGQLSHGAVTIETVTIEGSVAKFRIIRTFTNNSGASITVYEVGLFVQILCGDGSTYSFMVARDVISGGISIPNGATLTVRYIFQVTT